MSAGDVEREREAASMQEPADSKATDQNHEIPGTDEGVGIGAGAEPNTFEPEEDPDATKNNTDT